jgi:DNA-binding beta-propeller fold protein YncE
MISERHDNCFIFNEMATITIIRGLNIMKGKVGNKGVIGMTICVYLLCLLLPLVAGAAGSIPEAEELTGITMNKEVLWSPGRLAMGGDGTLYVVDSYKNHILKFDRNGSYLGDIPFPRVSAIAVTPDGTLYIGSHQNYAVSIIKSGQVIGHLGAADNEFRSIRDIAYDAATGRIYVADNAGNEVRIFDTAGHDAGSIKGVNLPVSVEVTGDAIYVIDSPRVKDNTYTTTASRISIFDKQNNLLKKTIPESPLLEEEPLMYRPTDLKVVDGIIYVADAKSQSIVMLDTSGNSLGEITSADNGIHTAVSLDISPEGILYVSSSETHSIYMFNLTGNAGVGAGSGGSGL